MSMFSRVIVEREVFQDLKSCCRQFFNAVSLFLLNVTPTIQTIVYAIPRHSHLLFEKYGVSLGIISMQGREAKHVCLQQYARHSNISQRRNSVRSTTIFLLSGYENKTLSILLTIKIDLVIPKRVTQSEYCYCGYEKEATASKCHRCSSLLYKAVEASASLRKIGWKFPIFC